MKTFSTLVFHLWLQIHIAAASSVWTVSPWSRCSAPCDVGASTRQVTCRSSINNEFLPASNCSDPSPSAMKACVSPSCQWACAPNSSFPICLSSSLQQVPDAHCTNSGKPGKFMDSLVCPYSLSELFTITPSCDGCPAEATTYSWMTLSPWSSCRPMCGSSRSSWRHIACVDSSGTISEDTMCSGSRPDDHRPCPDTEACHVAGNRCHNVDGEVVADVWCKPFQRKAPPEVHPGSNYVKKDEWNIESDWSPCDVSTFVLSTRRVVCGSEPCTSPPPESVRQCSESSPLFYIKDSEAPLCSDACGISYQSNAFSCSLQDMMLPKEVCQSAGVPDPLQTVCQTGACNSGDSGSCDLRARMNVSVPSGVFSVDQVQTLFIADMESAIPQSDSVNVNSVVKLNVDRYGIDFTVTCKDLSYPVADSIAGQLLDVNSTLRQGIITRGVQGGFVPVKNDEKSPEGDGYEPVYAVVAVFVVAFVLVMALIKRCMPKQHQLVSTSVDARDLDPSFPKSPSQHSHAIRLPKFSAISQARRTSFEVPVNLKSHGLP